MGALDSKLDFIIGNMKNATNKSSSSETDKAKEPWEEVKTWGWLPYKTKKLRQKLRLTSTSSFSNDLEETGETKHFAIPSRMVRKIALKALRNREQLLNLIGQAVVKKTYLSWGRYEDVLVHLSRGTRLSR